MSLPTSLKFNYRSQALKEELTNELCDVARDAVLFPRMTHSTGRRALVRPPEQKRPNIIIGADFIFHLQLQSLWLLSAPMQVAALYPWHRGETFPIPSPTRVRESRRTATAQALREPGPARYSKTSY